MAEETRRRIEALARDQNVDLEDLRYALAAAQADGSISLEEEATLREHLHEMEPAAQRYLDDVLAGSPPQAPRRALLAPHPRDEQKDLYYARADAVALQDALGRAGFPTRIDGDYGPATAASVGAAQVAAGLPRTGALDSETLLALNERLSARGEAPLDVSPRARIRPDAVVALRGRGAPEDVRALQQGLSQVAQRLGLPGLQGDEEGVFGPATEAAVKVLQRIAYLPETGLVDTATLDALNAALDLAELPAVTIAARGGFEGKVELHFYPGPAELKVYVLRAGALLDTYGMVGGHDASRADPGNSRVTFDPTPKGEYVVDLVSPHASSVWAYSYVPYGAPLREVDGEVQFRDGAGTWRWATGPRGEFAGRTPEPLPRAAYLDPDGRLMGAWLRNDFGHLRARLRRVGSGAIQAHMIHAVPLQEETPFYFAGTARLMSPDVAAWELGYSHGCEHIHPRDLDEMIARGYLAPGTRFVVHGYDEVFTPPASAAPVPPPQN